MNARCALLLLMVASLARGTHAEFVPLTDLRDDARYKGQTGGLYGDADNQPPDAHLKLAMSAAAQIKPLNPKGEPSPDGSIVLLSIGMSNTTQEFSRFKSIADKDERKNPRLLIVDGAQGGRDAADWATTQQPWDRALQLLSRAGASPAQVQVIWIKQALKGPARLGDFPKHSDALKTHLADIVIQARQRFPNLRIAYLSSRTYAGYATTQLNPEPYAYESAFSVRSLILDQIAGQESLNPTPAKGPVKAPVLLWGPYLWSNGAKGRAANDLLYTREDFANDGTHPSDSGRNKVAGQLLTFFTTDPTARTWFTGRE